MRTYTHTNMNENIHTVRRQLHFRSTGHAHSRPSLLPKAKQAMYVCMHVCICMYIFRLCTLCGLYILCVCVCARARACVCVYACFRRYGGAHFCSIHLRRLFIYEYVRVCMYVCMYVRRVDFGSTALCRLSINDYVHVCVYVCMYEEAHFGSTRTPIIHDTRLRSYSIHDISCSIHIIKSVRFYMLRLRSFLTLEKVTAMIISMNLCVCACI
jgi:hypothetical protein